ncbi:MAG: thiamine pyrophosphate-dependent enzyme, partial [Candidatus Promineifilaceae bacterium]|nr:thiamine pyrophosphate-dependent enzyme [Candidatus Promineifilaceae bacterium]
PRFQNYLMAKDLLSEEDVEALEEEIEAEIQDAVDAAEAEMESLAGEALSMFEHIYAEMPPYLREQRSQLKAELEANDG